jgi:hypothetical protein
MISASKTIYTHYNLNILIPKVKKNIKNLLKKFCEFPPGQEIIKLQQWKEKNVYVKFSSKLTERFCFIKKMTSTPLI